MPITLVIGGARSGKSSYGEKLAAGISENVAYIATAQSLDEEMQARISLHRSRRPQEWTTYEVPLNISKVVQEIKDKHDVFLLDCLTLLITNILLKDLNIDNITTEIQIMKEDLITREIEKLICYFKNCNKHLIVITNEVGLGLVPSNALSRIYRDIAGRINQLLAEDADTVILTWAGIPLQIKPDLVRL
ncbi:MAG: hypothetical protein VR72_00895 [Clostridiaceae bacterium BRH_c20a]|nr:MAG: hypothetical protein VR72_00895 [Clostridiaceae bacterium BRH_c20a]